MNPNGLDNRGLLDPQVIIFHYSALPTEQGNAMMLILGHPGHLGTQVNGTYHEHWVMLTRKLLNWLILVTHMAE